MIDFIHKWGGKRSGLSELQIVGWVGIARSKFYDWQTHYGKANEHNSWIPRDHWIDSWERDAMVKFAREFPLEGYRRLTFMMLDRDIVAVSPSTAYRVLKAAGLIQRWNGKPSKKGTGFVQPLAPTSTGMWTSLTSKWPGRFTTFARCSTDALASSSTQSCASP